MSKFLHYVLGASLGTSIQPTAVAVLEHEVWKNEHWEPETVALRLRYLERILLDVGYPGMVERINTLLNTAGIKDEECDETPDVVLDVTGSGRAPVTLFEGAGIEPIVVTITGASGREEEVNPDDWRIPKIELVGNLQVLYQKDRLKMARAGSRSRGRSSTAGSGSVPATSTSSGTRSAMRARLAIRSRRASWRAA